jgi:hypothetical protein
MSKRSRISGPYVPYGLFQTKRETCGKFGSDRFRNVNLCEVHTYIQTDKQTNKRTFIFIYQILISVCICLPIIMWQNSEVIELTWIILLLQSYILGNFITLLIVKYPDRQSVIFKVCKSAHHRTIQINHQPDATIFQFIILTFIYSSTCFGRFPAHNQELNDCSGNLWFYLRIVVIVVLCSWSGRPAGDLFEKSNITGVRRFRIWDVCIFSKTQESL